MSFDRCIGRVKPVELQVNGIGLPVGSRRHNVCEDDIDRPGFFGGGPLTDVMFDPRRDIGRLRQAETDQLSPSVTGRQRGANASSELLVQCDLVPRTVHSGNHRRSMQTFEAGPVELDRYRVCRQARAQRQAGFPAPDRSGY